MLKDFVVFQRVGLILELRGLHKELKEEKSHRENAFQEAMMVLGFLFSHFLTFFYDMKPQQE